MQAGDKLVQTHCGRLLADENRRTTNDWLMSGEDWRVQGQEKRVQVSRWAVRADGLNVSADKN